MISLLLNVFDEVILLVRNFSDGVISFWNIFEKSGKAENIECMCFDTRRRKIIAGSEGGHVFVFNSVSGVSHCLSYGWFYVCLHILVKVASTRDARTYFSASDTYFFAHAVDAKLDMHSARRNYTHKRRAQAAL